VAEMVIPTLWIRYENTHKTKNNNMFHPLTKK